MARKPLYAWLPKYLPRNIEYLAYRVTTLYVDTTSVGDLQSIGMFGHLEHLSVNVSGDSRLDLDECLPNLSSLTRLADLSLIRMRLSDADVARLQNLHSLCWLDLSCTEFQNTSISRLKHLLALRILVLDRTTITDEGVAHLAKITGLDELRLRDTAITDRAIESLVAIPHLRRLDISDTNLTRKGVAELRQSLGSTIVFWDKPELLLEPGALHHSSAGQRKREPNQPFEVRGADGSRGPRSQ